MGLVGQKEISQGSKDTKGSRGVSVILLYQDESAGDLHECGSPQIGIHVKDSGPGQDADIVDYRFLLFYSSRGTRSCRVQ